VGSSFVDSVFDELFVPDLAATLWPIASTSCFHLQFVVPARREKSAPGMNKIKEKSRRAFHFGKAFAVVLPILAVVTITAIAHAETIVGRISSVNGAVQIVRGSRTLTATNGMAIRLHDKVVTGTDGSVTIVLPDHSSLHLGQSGTLLIGKSTNVEWLHGAESAGLFSDP
jgi:hypothetical protein